MSTHANVLAARAPVPKSQPKVNGVHQLALRIEVEDDILEWYEVNDRASNENHSRHLSMWRSEDSREMIEKQVLYVFTILGEYAEKFPELICSIIIENMNHSPLNLVAEALHYKEKFKRAGV